MAVFGNDYYSPDGKEIKTETSLGTLFSDDFGGSAVDLTKWDVLDGGQQVGSVIGGQVSTVQIGSGITGMTDSVSNSALNVTMSQTLGAERWYLSQRVFAGKEDILVVTSRTGTDVGNSIFIGLVEVDPITHIPLLNPNIAADSNGSMEHTNRAGVEFGLNAANTAYHCEAIGDSSPTVASGLQGTAAVWSTSQECLIEIDSRDIIASTASVDNITAKVTTASRVSTQCANDTKLYKLILKFKNKAAPAVNNVVTIQRIIVVQNYEQRVQVATAEGDTIANKALPVNITTFPSNVVPNTGAAVVGAGTGMFVDPDNYPVTDLASAAITTTTTSATVSPKAVGGVAQFEVQITAASGTTPTFDVVIQESNDGGVNWIDLYHFERITAIGNYHTPPLYLTGSKIRYIQTVGGTTPSFTRVLTRNTQPFCDNSASQVFRIYDRTVAVNTLSSNTASMRTRGCANYSMTVNMGAITTTAPQFQLQGSDDGGVTWYSIGTPLTSVASSTVVSTINNVYAQLIRATISTAGSGATLGYVCLKAF